MIYAAGWFVVLPAFSWSLQPQNVGPACSALDLVLLRSLPWHVQPFLPPSTTLPGPFLGVRLRFLEAMANVYQENAPHRP